MTQPTYRMEGKHKEVNHLLAGPQRYTMLVGGSRSGKTTLLVRATCMRALRASTSRHVILRQRLNSVRQSIIEDTFPKVMKMCFPGVNYRKNGQDSFVEFANKAQIWFGGLDDSKRVENILGKEFSTIYFNEASQIAYESYLLAMTRLAQVIPGLTQRCYVDLNPGGTGHWTYRLFLQKMEAQSRQPLPDPDDYQFAYINPLDNAANLDPKYLTGLASGPARTRKRFFEGVYTPEVENALWTIDTFDQHRILPADCPDLQRVVVAVDPSGTKGNEGNRNDDVGIVVAGLGVDGRGYILADWTCNMAPEGWGRRTVEAYRLFAADRVVGESNFGGDMVRFTIQVNDNAVPYTDVHASRGKVIRAEPVSNLYALGKVSHAGDFVQLEDEMSNFSTAGYMGEKSPNRADAMVMALTHLMLDSPLSLMDVM